MTRLVPGLLVAAILVLLARPDLPTAGAQESQRVKAVRDKMLPAKLKLDIDKKMLRAIISDDLPAAIKAATGLAARIEPAPGSGVTLTSSFELKGEMTLKEALNKICDEKSWGWYVNVARPGDQKEGAILLTTNPKDRGYKEGTGPASKDGKKEMAKKEAAKKDEPKDKEKPTETAKEKPKEEPKDADAERAAADLLSKARVQNSLKQTDKAKTTLNEIISKYPDTRAAGEAKKLLERIGK